jgi:hypothetical protein
MSIYNIITLAYTTLNIQKIEYKYQGNNLFEIKITTTGSHNIFGNVKIQFSNFANVNVDGVANFFNTTLITFKNTGLSTLEGSVSWSESSWNQANILNKTTNFTLLPNNGTPITALVNNTVLDVKNVNIFNFFIADSVATSGVTNQAVSNPIGTGNNNKVSISVADYAIINDNVVLYTDDVEKHWDSVYKRQFINTIGKNIRIGISDFVANTRVVINYQVS